MISLAKRFHPLKNKEACEELSRRKLCVEELRVEQCLTWNFHRDIKDKIAVCLYKCMSFFSLFPFLLIYVY